MHITKRYILLLIVTICLVVLKIHDYRSPLLTPDADAAINSSKRSGDRLSENERVGTYDTPNDSTPNDSTPNDSTANGSTPKDDAPEDTTPEDTTPKDTTPKDDSPKDDSANVSSWDDLYNMTKVKNIDLGNIDFLDEYYRYNYDAIHARITERMANIHKVCQSSPKARKYSGNRNMYLFSSAKLSWCPIYKSGSSTWRNYFIDKFVPNHGPYHLKYLGRFSIKTKTPKPQGNIRFTIVRHPLARLISHVHNAAKDNEMVAMKNAWIYNAMLQGRQSQLTGMSTNDASKHKTEFTRYFDWLRTKKGTFAISEDNPYLNPPYPKLEELVGYLVRSHKSNGHWTPGYQFCSICNNQFDYIIKLEEEPLELWYLVDKLGLWKDRAVFLGTANNSTGKKYSATELESMWQDDLQSLNKVQRAWVNQYFDIDFQMFDYKLLPMPTS